MEITWYGQSCFKIKGKSATVITDPFDPGFSGLKLPKDFASDLVLVSHQHQDHNNWQAVLAANPEVIVAEGPGEYEVKGASVIGTNSFHDDASGAERGTNTIYHILIDGINIVHLGDLGHLLSEEQVEEINQVDILMIPVGGVFSIDAEVAGKVIAQLEPRIIIPMHFKIDGLKFDLNPLEPFLKEMGAEGVEALPKLVVTKDKLPEETQVTVLSKN